MLDILKALHESEVRESWEATLELLSLDRARPFWKDLGLPLKDPDEAFAAVRRFISSRESLDMDMTEDDDEAKLLWRSWRFLGELGLSQGEAAVRALWDWAQASGENEPRWHWMWRILLYHLGKETPADIESWAIPAKKAGPLIAIGGEWVRWIDDLEARLERAKQEKKTTWDETRNSEYQFANDDDEGDLFDALQVALEWIPFDRHWARVVALLSPDEMEALIRWGKARYADLQDPESDEEPDELALTPKDAIVPLEMRMRN